MRLLLGVCLLFTSFALVRAGDEKKAEVIVEETSPNELAKAFKDDPDAARKKYIRTEKDKIDGKPLVQLVGEYQRDGMNFTIKTKSSIDVVLRAKKVTGEGNGVMGQGFVVQFEKNQIVIDCEEVKLVPFAGK